MTRYTSPDGEWMIQRPLDACAALDDAGRARVRTELAGTGCKELVERRLRQRLVKRGFPLTFEGAR